MNLTMNKNNKSVFQIVFSLLLLGCANSKNVTYKNEIIKSCELQNYINDTIIVRGFYSECVEYSSFYLVKKDKCRDSFNMDLHFSNNSNFDDYRKDFNQIVGCNQFVELTLKGIARNSIKQYGHLGSNNSEFEVIEILNFGKIRN